MSHSTGIFTERHILVLTQYRPSGTFRLGIPHISIFTLWISNQEPSKRTTRSPPLPSEIEGVRIIVISFWNIDKNFQHVQEHFLTIHYKVKFYFKFTRFWIKIYLKFSKFFSKNSSNFLQNWMFFHTATGMSKYFIVATFWNWGREKNLSVRNGKYVKAAPVTRIFLDPPPT